MHKKVKDLERFLCWLDEHPTDVKLVVTNGCFDLFHLGHLRTIQAAKTFGTHLLVIINDDESITRTKGLNRPIIPLEQRTELVCALPEVDFVIVQEHNTPLSLLQQIRPQVLVKGATTGEIVGQSFVESYGGQVVRLDGAVDVSTTTIVQKIQTLYSQKG